MDDVCRCNTATGEWEEIGGVCDWFGEDAAPPDQCNPVTQSGCGAGSKCALIADDEAPDFGSLGCAPDGTAAIGEPCTEPEVAGESDTCRAGGECYNGYCHRICSSADSNCGDGWCLQLVDGAGNPSPIEFCLPACDLLTQACASPLEGCYYAFGLTVCVDVGAHPVGAPCQYANECEPGLQCTGDPGVCRRLCGPLLDCWEVDGLGGLVTPTACGCGPTVACASSEICWPIPDVDGIPATAGVCFDEVELLECSCSSDPICTL